VANTTDKKLQPIVIKKIKKGGGHHGGAWKVAYADFVTAMMAFFLLLWLLNVTTDEQREAISNFFDPTHPKVSSAVSGAGGVLGGLSMAPQGAMATNLQEIINNQPETPPSSTKANTEQSQQEQSVEEAKELIRQHEEKEFEKTQEAIRQAIQDDPELSQLAKNLIVDMTPEGLRIQIVDQEGEPMFPSGSARMYEKTQKLMGKITAIINTMPNEISIRGHTDSVPYGPRAEYTNWELSTDRANSSRRTLLNAGLPAERLHNVMGKADSEHLLPDDPKNAQNRRISIVLMKRELTDPNFQHEAEKLADELRKKDASRAAPPKIPVGTFRRTPGSVEFP
jgi:chemotaxis protein MotB